MFFILMVAAPNSSSDGAQPFPCSRGSIRAQADALRSSIKMIIFPHFTSSLTRTYKVRVLLQDSLLIGIEELFVIFIIIPTVLCVYVCF